METKVYNQEGKEVGTKKVSEKVFGFSWNADLVRQVFLSERATDRRNIAHTKDRRAGFYEFLAQPLQHYESFLNKDNEQICRNEKERKEIGKVSHNEGFMLGEL